MEVSFNSPALPSKLRSTTKRRNPASRSERANPLLEMTLLTCARTASGSTPTADMGLINLLTTPSLPQLTAFFCQNGAESRDDRAAWRRSCELRLAPERRGTDPRKRPNHVRS